MKVRWCLRIATSTTLNSLQHVFAAMGTINTPQQPALK